MLTSRRAALPVNLIRKHPWIFLAAVAVVGFVLDIATKRWAVAALEPRQQIKVVGDALSFVLVYNKGALFGLDPRNLLPWLPLNLVFYVFSVVAIAIVFYYYRMVHGKDTLAQWGLALVLPGALGNATDRILHPDRGVVDFIMVDLNVWPLDPWPIFNLADIYVTVGVLAIIASIIRDEIRRKATAEASHDDSTVPSHSASDELPSGGSSDETKRLATDTHS